MPTPLRALRAERGLGLRETARRANLNPGVLSQIERGKMNPTPEQMLAIAEALDLPRPLEVIPLTAMRP